MKLFTAFVTVLVAAQSSPASAQMKRLRKDESTFDEHKYTHTVDEAWGRAMHNLKDRIVKSPSKHTVDVEWGRAVHDLQAHNAQSTMKSRPSSKEIQEAIAAVASKTRLTCEDNAGCGECYECVYKVHDVYVCAPDPACTVDDDSQEPTFQCVVDQDIPGVIFPVCPGLPEYEYCDGETDCGSTYCACDVGLAFCDTGSNPCYYDPTTSSGDDAFSFSYRYLQPLQNGAIE